MSWGPIISVCFQIIGLILERVKASNDTVTAFKALIEASKNDGLISLQASDKFQKMHDELMQKFKEEDKKE